MGYSAPAFGLLSTGYVKKLTSDFELDLQTALRAEVDPNLDLSPTEPMGQATGIFADALAQADERIEAIYNGYNPNDAEGLQLDNVCSITGTKRRAATKSRVVLTCNLNASSTIPVGTQANVLGQPANLWQLIGFGTSTTKFTRSALVSTTAGNYSAVFEAVSTGPTVANAGTLTVITAGTVTGLNSITNPNDAVLGTDVETDAQLRLRREEELQQQGNGTLDAIRAALLEVPGVINAFVFENTTDAFDSAGRPPHSIEAIIFDGISPAADNNAVAQALWNNKPAGIPYYSATASSGVATDSQSVPQTVAFSRAVIVPIYLSYTVHKDTSFDTVNGPAAVKATVAAYAAAKMTLGSLVKAQLFAMVPVIDFPVYGIQGVVETTLTLDIVPSPVGTSDLSMSSRQYPYIQTANITVTVV